MVHDSSYSATRYRTAPSEAGRTRVEVDETFIGGKARNMHMDVGSGASLATGPTDKTAVLGVLERAKDEGIHSRVRTKVITDRKRKRFRRK